MKIENLRITLSAVLGGLHSALGRKLAERIVISATAASLVVALLVDKTSRCVLHIIFSSW